MDSKRIDETGGAKGKHETESSRADQSGGESVILNAILARFDNLSTEVKNISKNVSTCNNEIKEAVNFMKNNLKKFNTEITQLKLTNKKLNDEVADLKSQIEVINQQSYNNTVKISNIPQTENESLSEIIQKISDVIGYEFSAQKLDSLYRRQSRKIGLPSIIVLRFLRRLDKLQFLQLKKSKGDIFTSDLGMEGERRPIYISEFMSPFNSKLFWEAKQLKLKNLIQFVWFRNGRVLIKKCASSPTEIISKMDDLKIFQSCNKNQTSQLFDDDDCDESELDQTQSILQPNQRNINKKRKLIQKKKAFPFSTGSLEDFFRPRSASNTC